MTAEMYGGKLLHNIKIRSINGTWERFASQPKGDTTDWWMVSIGKTNDVPARENYLHGWSVVVHRGALDSFLSIENLPEMKYSFGGYSQPCVDNRREKIKVDWLGLQQALAVYLQQFINP